MKILSIITVGGQHIKWFVGCLVIMISVMSCDTGYMLPLDNNKFSYDISLSKDSMVKVSGMYFNGCHFLLFDLKGEYVINPDSLKLKLCDENITLGKLLPCSKTDTYNKNNTHVKNRLISVQLRYERKDKDQGINEPLVLFVLPSNFIMRNDKRVLTDSLRIVLKRPKGKYLW
jgi:hypothetical protein